MPTSNHENSTGASRQFKLRTLLLLVAGAACWFACYQMVRDTQQMQSELPGLRQAVRELNVRNPGQYAVIQRPEYWVNESHWDVYLPGSDRYSFCFALEGIKNVGVVESTNRIELGPGTHRIEFTRSMTEEEMTYSLVCSDGNLEERRPKASGSNGYSLATGETECLETKQQPTDKPLVLRRQRFNYLDGKAMRSDEPADGELVWIERLTQ